VLDVLTALPAIREKALLQADLGGREYLAYLVDQGICSATTFLHSMRELPALQPSDLFDGALPLTYVLIRILRPLPVARGSETVGRSCRPRPHPPSRPGSTDTHDPPEQKTRKVILGTVSVFGAPATLFHPIELQSKSPHHGAWRSKRA
jgi:hypothetical protein